MWWWTDMAQINESPQNVFIYDKTNDTWHQMGGKVATNANYIWTGAHQFNSNVLMNGNVQVTTKFNSYNTELERDEAMPNPTEGLISYIKYDNLGNEVNEFQYFDGNEWVPLIPDGIVFEDEEQTLTNKTLVDPIIQGGIIDPEYIQFDTEHNQATAVGKLMWNAATGTLSIGVENGDGSVTEINIGQQNFVRVANSESLTTIPLGAAVFASGSVSEDEVLSAERGQTDYLSIKDDPAINGKFLGIAAEPIESGTIGNVITYGALGGLNTASMPQGARLYVSAGTNGGITAIRPQSPDIAVEIGYCVKNSSTDGIIFVDVRGGFQVGQLDDVLAVDLQHRNIIWYNEAGTNFVNIPLLDAILEIDGPGSGIDADLLDGQQGAWYAPICGPEFTSDCGWPTIDGERIATEEWVIEMFGGDVLPPSPGGGGGDANPQDGNMIVGLNAFI
jgi:hypothetical protein